MGDHPQNFYLNDLLYGLRNFPSTENDHRKIYLEKITFLSPDEKLFYTLEGQEDQLFHEAFDKISLPFLNWLPVEIILSVEEDVRGGRRVPLHLTSSGLRNDSNLNVPDREQAFAFLKEGTKVKKYTPLSLLMELCEQKPSVNLTFQHLGMFSFKPSTLSLISRGFLHQTGRASALVCSRCSPPHFAPVKKDSNGKYSALSDLLLKIK